MFALCVACLPDHGATEPFTDSGSGGSAQELGPRNGTRLRPLPGWRCEDGAFSLQPGFFDSNTGQPCGPNIAPGGDFNGVLYCAPSSRQGNPATDVRCQRVFMP